MGSVAFRVFFSGRAVLMISKAKLVFATTTLQAAVCVAVISAISYTEIDWKAYMQQCELFTLGERNYTKLIGGTVSN